jgi:nickel transport protein
MCNSMEAAWCPSGVRATLALLPALLLVAILACPSQGLAHGTGSRWLEGPAAPLVVLFHYSTGEPMAWVAIKVYGPGDTAMEYQDARTDKAGVFAFVPDRPGSWRVVAKDDQGHQAVAETTVSTSMVRHDGSSSQPAAASQGRAVALGLSLLLNLLLGLLIWRRKRPAQQKA